GTVRRAQIVEENEVPVGDDLAGCVQYQGGGVQVEVRARGGAQVPAETHAHRVQPGRLFCQRDVPAFGETDTHAWPPDRMPVGDAGAAPRIMDAPAMLSVPSLPDASHETVPTARNQAHLRQTGQRTKGGCVAGSGRPAAP